MIENETDTVSETDTDQKVIRHIVLSGGTVYGLSLYGSLKYLHEKKVWKHEDIKSIYATSAGTLMAVIVALGIEWDILDVYLTERPWEQVFKFNLHSLLNSYSNCGILSFETIEDALRPLFLSKDIKMSISLQEFYYKYDIDIHFFTVQLDSFELVDISYKTHPYWTVVEAVYASACAPIAFKPFMKKGKAYTDGGIIANYPLQQCMDVIEKDEEVLGIRINNVSISEITNADLNTKICDNLHEYLQHIVKHLCRKMNSISKNTKTPFIEIIIPTTIIPINDLYSFANSQDVRKKLIQHGIECCEKIK